jgi:filamentous hemagglutinin
VENNSLSKEDEKRLAGGNLGGALAGASAPELAHLLKSTEGDPAVNTLAHAILGGVVAAIQGKSAAAGAAGAASGELIARAIAGIYYPDVKMSDLTEEQKQTISSLASISAGMAGGIAGGDVAGAATGASAGKNAVENNYLSVSEADRKKQLETKRDYLKQDLTTAETKELADINQTDKDRDQAIKAACTDGNKGGGACSALIAPAQEALKKYGENATYSLLYKDLYPQGSANLESVLQGLDTGSIGRDQAITAIAKASGVNWETAAGRYDTAMQTQALVSTLAGYYGINSVSSTGKTSNATMSQAEKVKENIASSQAARESSNFSQFSKAEGAVQESLGIWPPNRGAYGPVEQVTLPTGAIVDRYGYPGGSFVSPVGVPFENRALPPSYETTKPYFQYVIMKPISDVPKSNILPWFGQKGTGTQYELPQSVQWYLDNDYMKKVDK